MLDGVSVVEAPADS